MKLFLDDIRTPEKTYGSNDWAFVRTYDACIEELKKGHVTHLSLDNDLGTEKEGRDVLTELAFMVLEDGIPLPVVRAHTANPVSRQDIARAYEALKFHARREGCTVLEDNS